MALIYLCGITGVGKSTIGPELARQLNYDFVDIDAQVVDESCMTIAEIFEEEGEGGFRKREAAEVAKTATLKNTVIALGGGALKTPDNLKLILEHGVLVYLRAEPAVIVNRVFGDARRPMLAGYDTPEALEEMFVRLLAERKPLYEQAQATFDVSPAAAPLENAGNLLAELRRRLLA